MNLALLATLLLAAGSAQRSGQVLQTTGKRAYLDAGSRDGLKAGMRLTTGKGRSCTVERVASHQSSCVGNVNAGDRFELPSLPAPASRPPRPLSPRELKRRRDALEAIHPALVDFVPSGVAAEPAHAGRRARIALSHATWAAREAGPWQRERADVSLHMPIAGPVRLDADLSAERWSRRPATARFRPDDPWQLYVRQLALTAAVEPGARASLGRLRPFATGATALDGLSTSWRFAGGSELGIYGGALPDPFTTAPETDRYSAGAAWRVQHAGTTGDVFRWARHEGRAAIVSLPGGERRYELEAAGSMSLGRAVDVSGMVRLATGALAPDDKIDALRFELVARLGDEFRFNAAVRHQALPFPVDALTSKIATAETAAAFTGGPSRHGDASASWDIADHLQISATGGVSIEGIGLRRSYGGPEVALPGLLRGTVTLSGGYLEERGWVDGRSAWAQLAVTPRAPLNLTLRGTWSWDQRGDAPGNVQEFGAFASAGIRPVRWLELRGSIAGRLQRSGDGGGLTAFISAAGEY